MGQLCCPPGRAVIEPGFSLEAVDERGGTEALWADDEVVAASEVRRLQERVRELERLLSRNTMERIRSPMPPPRLPSSIAG